MLAADILYRGRGGKKTINECFKGKNLSTAFLKEYTKITSTDSDWESIK